MISIRQELEQNYDLVKDVRKALWGTWEAQHTVFRVRLRSTAEYFAIDLTGPLYGYIDTVVPWNKCVRKRWVSEPTSQPWGICNV